MIQFESPKNQSSIIKVIGVGGGGGNAVSYMYNLGIEGVDFVVCNTDSQALTLCEVPNKIQLGPHLTQGLGAGANPEIGKQAGEESIEDITKILEVKTKMAFITAGMGGGTGTGSAPVIAKICKDLGILTVGIVTTPFSLEGRKRLTQAKDGVATMQDYVDTILIISNDKLRQQYGNLPFSQAFAKADDILATAAKCITDLITVDGRVNLDFNDVQTVMQNGGVAILGSASAEGEDRAKTAVVQALNSPLLNDSEIEGAKWILLNVTSSQGESEHTLDELDIIQSYVQEQAGNTCDIILGMGHDPNLEGKIAVTIIATGFEHKNIETKLPPARKAQDKDRVVVTLGQENAENLVQANADKNKEQKNDDSLAPKLVNEISNQSNKEGKTKIDDDVKERTNKQKTSFTLELPDDDKEKEPASSEKQLFDNDDNHQEPSDETNGIQLIFKNDTKSSVQKPNNNQEQSLPKIGSRTLSESEVAERKEFEERKRKFEERAAQLRKMSIDCKNGTLNDEMEKVPAYVRNQLNIEEPTHSSDEYLSGYYVENNKNGNPNHSNIRTINTYLEGNKPD